MLIRIGVLVAAALSFGVGVQPCLSQEARPGARPLPPAQGRAVDFHADIYPLLKARCFKCHAGSQLESGIRLDFRPELLGETNGRPLVLTGRSALERLHVEHPPAPAPRGHKVELGIDSPIACY